jgi:hypothetical protein
MRNKLHYGKVLLAVMTSPSYFVTASLIGYLNMRYIDDMHKEISHTKEVSYAQISVAKRTNNHKQNQCNIKYCIHKYNIAAIYVSFTQTLGLSHIHNMIACRYQGFIM